MHIGTQITAPDGWDQMPEGVVFHFLCNDRDSGRVLLAHFQTPEIGSPTASILVMNRDKFEEGASLESIRPLPKQSLLPPWLEDLEGIDLSELDGLRTSGAKISHLERVECRFLHIAPAIRDFKAILAADDPQAEINARAGLCKPAQHESRFRLWTVTYLCFGYDMWTLLPPFHRIGHWDRFDHADTKLGAPSIAYGRNYGNGCSEEMAEQCVKSYLKRAELGRHITDIYEDAMDKDFGCRTSTLPSGMKIYSHPKGAPFPTYWQFRYRILLAIGLENVQNTLYGAARHRNRIAPSKGRFSEEIANLLERIEADGRYTKEHPRGYIDGSVLPPLCVVECRDLLSGKKLGIGFAFGKERGDAYRMMLFCMAVPKDFFCKLFGVKLVKGEWVNQGLPSHFAIDRGPGARKDLIAELEKRFPIRDMSPSWSGQSKATVESGHKKEVKSEGEPNFLKSNLTPVELVRREIYSLIKFNNTANMEDRIDPDSELAFVPATPIGLWNHYDKLFRNDAQPLRIDEAVRTFLTPTKFSVREDGVYLGARRFYSDELRAAGILSKTNSTGDDGPTIDGYVLDMCVRHVWVEVKGRLMMLDAKLRIRGAEDDLYLSITELAQWSEQRAKMKSALRVHQRAASSDIKERFEDDTGKAWDGAYRAPGKAKKDAVATQEAKEAEPMGSKRKSA